MSKEIRVANLPNCDFCGQVANYDGQTILGSAWANMCQSCFESLGKGLGLGLGQRLVLSK
jgi:hypothetical protein